MSITDVNIQAGKGWIDLSDEERTLLGHRLAKKRHRYSNMEAKFHTQLQQIYQEVDIETLRSGCQ